jgi:hypothetical protein
MDGISGLVMLVLPLVIDIPVDRRWPFYTSASWPSAWWHHKNPRRGKGGIVSVPCGYGGLRDKIPFGAAMNKGLTMRTGQTRVNRYSLHLLKCIAEGEIDLRLLIKDRAKLGDGPELYVTFRDKEDNCFKVVLTAR